MVLAARRTRGVRVSGIEFGTWRLISSCSSVVRRVLRAHISPESR